MKLKLLSLLVCWAATLCAAQDAINFGGSAPAPASAPAANAGSGDGVGTRNLLAETLGLHPTADVSREFTDGSGGDGGDGAHSESLTDGEFCCCTTRSRCPNPNRGGGGGNLGINPRLQNDTKKQSAGIASDIGTRIVNDPPHDDDGGSSHEQPTCNIGERLCCYRKQRQLDRVSKRCVPLDRDFNDDHTDWTLLNCNESGRRRRPGKQCGQRSFSHASGLRRGQASPEEFPWTCLILDQDNTFIGTCAIIPEDIDNNINRGTNRVITAAHKLDKIGETDLVKVRVLEYDANGFRAPELRKHQEYIVSRIRVHPDYVPRRFINDIAILTLEKRIELRQEEGVNAACLPGCRDMFGYQFSNGTGTRCWVAGWGRDGKDGPFQAVMKKVDVPLYDRTRCQGKLRDALHRSNPLGDGRNLVLHQSEICAGGEAGKDACDGDGGAPLVCQAPSGAFYVVGLVTWGVDCAERGVPGVYARVSHFRDFLRRDRN